MDVSEGESLTYDMKWQIAVQRHEQNGALTRFFFFSKEKILSQTVLSRWGCVILNRFESLLDSTSPTELIYKLSQVSSARREKISLLVCCEADRGQVPSILCQHSLEAWWWWWNCHIHSHTDNDFPRTKRFLNIHCKEIIVSGTYIYKGQ